MKKLLTLALALVVLVVFTSFGAAQEERRGKGLPSAQEERKEVSQVPPAEVATACKNKKPGDTVKVGGKAKMCPPPCCYINGCIYPQNRHCFDE